ncbi:MAG TPA: hypothetical protein VD866_11455, partial [Urbifossiella sp.]|nr:hypothetical protein [Urbifossiella sp.]
FHVFRFDWRGHGGSTDIVDPLGDNMPLGGVLYSGFFTNGITGSWNQRYVKDGSKAKKPNEIKVKGGGITAPYFPVYANDLAAARLHLDQKNDNNDVNTSSIYVIGAGDTATLGMMWLSSEWLRPATHPMLPAGLQYMITPMRGIVVNPPAGGDIAGAVWLSASRPASTAGVPDAAIKGWAKASIKLRDNTKMLFLYGAADAAADKDSKFFYDQVLVAGGNKAAGLAQVEQTFRVDVGKTKLSGVDMLASKDVNAEVKIVDYLKARQKDRVNMVRKNRNYISPYYIDVNYFLNLR